MNLLVWCWLYDRRMLCRLSHGRTRFVYIWILPCLVSLTTLATVLDRQIFHRDDHQECENVSQVKTDAQFLTTLVYLLESVLALTIFTSLGMVIKTKLASKQLVERRKGERTAVSPHYDYLWLVRDTSLKSCVGLSTLALACLNYACSIYYIRSYLLYKTVLEENNFDAISCEIEGSWLILSYCSLFIVPLDSLPIVIYSLSCLLKTCHAIGFAMPVTTTKLKKKYWGIPRQFHHYEGEFDFQVDASDSPLVWHRSLVHERTNSKCYDGNATNTAEYQSP